VAVKDKQAKPASGLEEVTARNDWYRDRYPLLLRAVAFLSVATLINAALLAYLATRHVEPRYFVADPKSGTVIQIEPVDRPLLSSDALAQWASDTARRAYSYDFANYAEQVQALRDRFEPSAFDLFVNELGRGILAQVKENRTIFVATADPAVITTSGVAPNGHFFWRVEVPVRVVGHRGGDASRTQSMRVTMEIMRVDNRVRPESGVVVTRFLTRTV
jgi:intracellular multiplication protein IcmL